MRVELTTRECIWLAELASKEKEQAYHANEENPHPLFELRHDNMLVLENKLRSAVKRQNDKIRSDAR